MSTSYDSVYNRGMKNFTGKKALYLAVVIILLVLVITGYFEYRAYKKLEMVGEKYKPTLRFVLSSVAMVILVIVLLYYRNNPQAFEDLVKKFEGLRFLGKL